MPTVFREGPYRFFFYSNEQGEPPHVHVQRDGAAAKLWLGPVSLAGSIGFNVAELRAITRIVSRNEHLLRESWHDFFRQ